MADTVVTLRPNSDDATDPAWSLTGGASYNAVWSDNSDSTYGQNAGDGNPVYVGFGTFSFPALSQIKSVTPRVRSGTSGATGQGLVCGLASNGSPTTTCLYLTKSASTIVTDTGSAITYSPNGFGAWTQTDIDLIQLAVQEFNNVAGLRVYEVYLDVAYNRAPTGTPTLPTGNVTTTSKPTIQWTYSDPESDTQERARVKIFSSTQYGAGGFDPESSSSTLDSGELLQSTNTWTATTALTAGITYKAYVKVSDLGSSGRYGVWTAGPTFTIVASAGLIFDPPATPAVLSATPDATNNRFAILVQGQDNEMTRNQFSFETGIAGLFADTNLAASYPQRNLTQFVHGNASATVRSGAAGNVVVRTTSALTLGALQTEAFKVTPGLTYTAMVNVKESVANTRTGTISIFWYTSAGAAASTASNTGTGTSITNTGFLPSVVQATAPANAAYAVVFYTIAGSTAANEDYYLDRFHFAVGSGLTFYRGGFVYPIGSILDTFTRADNAASLGNSEGTGTPAWVAGAGTWGISSNQAYLASATANAAAYIATNEMVDGRIICDVKLSATASRADVGVLFRGADATNFLVVRLIKNAGNDGVFLYKNVAGTYTALTNTTSQGLVNGNTYGLKVEFFGGKVRVYLDLKGGAGFTKIIDFDMVSGDVTAFAAATNTRNGMYINTQAGQDDGGSRIDNFDAQLPDVQRAYVERSLDGGVTWALARLANGVDLAYPGQQGTFYDYEVGPGVTPQYRAYIRATESDQTVQSATSGAVAASGTITLTDWWLKDPLDPTRNTIVKVAPPFTFKKEELVQVYKPLGRSTAVFVTDGVKGINGSLTLYSKDATTYAKIQTLLNAGRALQLQDPLGRSWYIKVSGDQEWTQRVATKLASETTPLRHYHEVTVPFEEVAIPAVT